MKRIAAWLGDSPDKVYVKMNTDFVDVSLSPQEITALLQALQAGAISQDTFLYNMLQGERLPPGRTIEEEKLLIEAEGVDDKDKW
jgi:hypothetical protein